MDLLTLVEILVLLVCMALNDVCGFPITGKTKDSEMLVQDDSMDNDYINDISRGLRYLQSLQDTWPQFEDILNDPNDPNIFNSITSYDSKYPSSSDSVDDDDTIKDIGDNNEEDNVKKFNDDIDVIATITYPADVLKDTDDLLSSAPKFNLLAVPSKRQQGWWIQYGKRTQNPDKPKNLHSINYDFLKSKLPKVSTSAESPDSDSANEWSSEFQFDLDIGKHQDAKKNKKKKKNPKSRGIIFKLIQRKIKDKKSSIVDDLHEPPVLWKRQQGWFTQYGKRSKEDLFS